MGWYRVTADLVLIVHTAFIAFVVLGLVLIWVGYFLGWSWTRQLTFRVVHLLGIGYVVLQAYAGMVCPLTSLENFLRVQAGQNPYGDAGFIAHWLHQIIFFSAPPWVFTICYTAFGLLVVGTLYFAPPQRRRKQIVVDDHGTAHAGAAPAEG